MQQNRSHAGETVRGRYWVVMAGVCPIVAYRPKPRREEELLPLVRARVRSLRWEGRAHEWVPVILRAKDGTTVEVTEWKSSEAIDAAHRNPDGHSIRAFARLTTE